MRLEDLVMSYLSNLEDQILHEFGSQRTSADQIEHAVRAMLIAADDRFSAPPSARTPADVYFRDDVLCHINIKSMDLSKDFHMPNLISASSLKKILTKGERFYLLRISHDAGQIRSKEIWDIRNIDWTNLQVSALGAGQIQLKNGTNPVVPHEGDTDSWMEDWRSSMVSYYEKEIRKSQKRIKEWSNL